MSIRTLLLCAALVSLSACEEALGPDRRGPGSLTFEIEGLPGEPSSAFVAEGDVPPDNGGVAPGDWAFAFRRGEADQRVVITASRQRSDGRSDAMTLQLPAGAQGGQTLQLRELCQDQASCAQLFVSFGLERGSNVSQTGCVVVSGSGHVAALTGRRAAGSFSGSAQCAGAFNGPILLKRGTFDVAVIAPEA